MKAPDNKRMEALETENNRLKHLLAESLGNPRKAKHLKSGIFS